MQPPFYAPQSPTPKPDVCPVPYTHPRPIWVVNLTNERITYDKQILTDEHSKEEDICS